MQTGWANNGNSYNKGFSNFLGIGNKKKTETASQLECSAACGVSCCQFLCCNTTSTPTPTSTPTTNTITNSPTDTFNSSTCSLIKPLNFTCYTCTTGAGNIAKNAAAGKTTSSPAAQAQAAGAAAAAGTKAVSNTLLYGGIFMGVIAVVGISYFMFHRNTSTNGKAGK